MSKVLLITGASSGIGEATARKAAQEGLKLILTARRKDKLDALVKEFGEDNAVGIAADAGNYNELEQAVKQGVDKFGQLDAVFANAGTGVSTPGTEEGDPDEWKQMIDVNIKGVMYGVGAVLPTMRKQESGHIINLSSVAGHVVFPGATVYCATKFAAKAISEGIRQESNGQIRSTNISPGAVATELTDHISHKDSKEMADDLYNDAIDSDSIARAITFAIEQPGEVDVNEMVIRPTKQEL